ncbi:AAA-ATPase [Mycobacterium phage Typha]|uniref:AAA-ATPase n=1 Tax=Mycobacterium phage Typha TaxID=2517971 RepID=A0A482J6U1_9CAUD|nr:AAA-ATPase [Mycobacterium phage Typha]QBP29780.1 AAA-ATPase [Mycobacterium phage Typha]
MGVVTLTGDRQAGKTHAALAVLALDAMTGHKCVYQGWDLTVATDVYRSVERLIPRDMVAKSYRARGEQRIELFNGGSVWFRSHRQSPITAGVHTYVVDDWLSGWLPAEVLDLPHVYVVESSAEVDQ